VAGVSEIRERVRQRYAAAARARGAANCCGGPPPGEGVSSRGDGCAPVSTTDRSGHAVFGGALYGAADGANISRSAVDASLGCGVPTAVADLHEGEIVLDLGSAPART